MGARVLLLELNFRLGVYGCYGLTEHFDLWVLDRSLSRIPCKIQNWPIYARWALAPILNSVCLAWDGRGAKAALAGLGQGLLAHRIAPSPRRVPLDPICRLWLIKRPWAYRGISWNFLGNPHDRPNRHSRRLHDCRSRHLVSGLSARRVSSDHNHTASHYTSQGCRRTPAARPARMFGTLRFVLPPILLCSYYTNTDPLLKFFACDF